MLVKQRAARTQEDSGRGWSRFLDRRMRITIEILDGLRRFGPGAQRKTLDVPDHATVGDALVSLGMDLGEPWNAALDGRLADPSDALHDGSRLIVFPAIDGG